MDVKVHQHSNATLWHETLRSVMLSAGLDKRPTALLATDKHDMPFSHWVDVNVLMTRGWVDSALEPTDEALIYETYKSACPHTGLDATVTNALQIVRILKRFMFVVTLRPFACDLAVAVDSSLTKFCATFGSFHASQLNLSITSASKHPRPPFCSAVC